MKLVTTNGFTANQACYEKMRVRLSIGCIAFIILLSGHPVHAETSSLSARATGMGLGYVTLARGVEAPNWNPANLGLSDNPKYSVQLIALGLDVGNNSFDLQDYNRYSGAVLNRFDIQKLLFKIPETGFEIGSSANLNLLGLSYNRFAFNSSIKMNVAGRIAKDYMDLIFNGNRFMRLYDLQNSQVLHHTLLVNQFSAGIPIQIKQLAQFAIGFSMKHLYGLRFEAYDHHEGLLLTTVHGINAAGQILYKRSGGGHGWGLDIGGIAILHSGLSIGISVSNIFGYVNWTDKNTEETVIVNANMMTLENVNQDSSVTLRSEPQKNEKFSYFPIKFLRVGISKQWEKWLVSGEISLVRRQYKFIDRSPQIHVGAEYPYRPNLLFRGGLTLGGVNRISPSFGIGIRKKRMVLDIAFVYKHWLSPFFAKGYSFAITHYFILN